MQRYQQLCIMHLLAPTGAAIMVMGHIEQSYFMWHDVAKQ